MGYHSMTSQIAEAPQPLAEEIQYHEQRLTEKEREFAEKSQWIQDARRMLNVFSGQYNSRVGVHYAKLGRLELEIKEYRFRVNRLNSDVKTFRELQEIEEEIARIFAEERESVKQKERDAEYSSESYRKHLRRKERSELFSPAMQEKIKVMFRKLALKFHPDKAQDPEQASEYQQIMAAINEAYGSGDMQVLIIYMDRADKEEKISRETSAEKLERLQAEYDKMCNSVKKLEQKIKETQNCETFRLKIMVDQVLQGGNDLLLQLTHSALGKIREAEEELTEWMLEYTELVTCLRKKEGI